MKQILILFIVFLTSCTTIKFDSSYDTKTKINLKKVIVITEDIYNCGFLKDFSDSLSKRLNINNIQTIFVFKDTLSFISSKDISLKINEFHPDAIIYIKRLTSHFSKTKCGYNYNGSAYYFGLRKNGNEADCWKAIITTEDEDSNYKKVLNITIDNIIKKIKDDTSQ